SRPVRLVRPQEGRGQRVREGSLAPTAGPVGVPGARHHRDLSADGEDLTVAIVSSSKASGRWGWTRLSAGCWTQRYPAPCVSTARAQAHAALSAIARVNPESDRKEEGPGQLRQFRRR